MKRFDDAKRYYRLAIDSDPNDPQLYHAIGIIDWTACFTLRTQERAKLGLKPEEHLDAQNNDQKKVCGELKVKNMANIQEGIDSLNMAIQLRPDYGDAMTYLNLMYRISRSRSKSSCRPSHCEYSGFRIFSQFAWSGR
jgi:tetratricopeptide (TPR) repeat protein